MNEELKTIAEGYREKYGFETETEDLEILYLDYYNRRFKTVTEAMISSAAVNALWVNGSFDSSLLNGQQIDSFTLAFPNLEINDVANYSGESLEGLITAWKGKLFEVKVRDDLNNGETVGNLHLENGQIAVLADSPTQPGWDLAIMDENGYVVDELQLKSTDLISYVENSAERYPDISILATSEVEGALSQYAEIIPTDFSNQQIGDELTNAVVGGGIDSAWDVILPILPLIINLYSIQKGSITAKEGAQNIAASAVTVGVGSVIAPLIDTGFALLDFFSTMGFGSLLFYGAKKLIQTISEPDKKQEWSKEIIDVEVINEMLLVSSKNAQIIGSYYNK
jgi:hypothetical protein